MAFSVSQLDYHLPSERIAQTPAGNRENARLLVLDRQTQTFDDRRVSDLPTLVRAGDCLVINDTRVVPAKFTLRRATGGRIEGLFVNECGPGRWHVLLRGASRLKEGEWLAFDAADAGDRVTALVNHGLGRWELAIEPPQAAETVLNRIGRTPIPPYIERADGGDPRADSDRARYQTVYAERPGAVAAPTAGLHFTAELLEYIRQAGVSIAPLTLHVGPGTFAPITAERIEQHEMHAEWYDLPAESVDLVRAARAAGGRVIAIGTTSLRVLETCSDRDGRINAGSGWTQLFIYPPCAVRGCDALLTNFHLPRSTLLALVMAFAGIERTRSAYQHAIGSGYRFYSYGDAMLIV